MCSRLSPASVFMKLSALVHFTTSETKKLLWTTVCLMKLLEPDHPMSRSCGKTVPYAVVRLYPLREVTQCLSRQRQLCVSFPWFWCCSRNKCSFHSFYMHLHRVGSSLSMCSSTRSSVSGDTEETCQAGWWFLSVLFSLSLAWPLRCHCLYSVGLCTLLTKFGLTYLRPGQCVSLLKKPCLSPPKANSSFP